MKTRFSILFALVIFFARSQSEVYPRPQRSAYAPGTIIPDHISRKQMDDRLAQFYQEWKGRYIRKDKCTGYNYVWSQNAGRNNECVSEGQGYGMMIVAWMATYDPEAQQLFNSLYRYCEAHPSKRNKYLMSWSQSRSCKNEASSAADGDIDIAYALLMASKQWPKNHECDYHEEAKKMISALLEQEVNQRSFFVLESNSIENDSEDYFDTRSSDFIPVAIKAFNRFFPDQRWTRVIDNSYLLFQHIQRLYSPNAGLVPDFIQHINIDPRPAKPNYLESKYDGMYNYNACRVPWRIASDYIFNGDPRAKKFVEPINNWIRTTTKGNPGNISAGYSLAGNDLPGSYHEALSFITPFAIAAMSDARNQRWLNSIWDYLVGFKTKDFDYFDNTIRMIGLIILSGNGWDV